MISLPGLWTCIRPFLRLSAKKLNIAVTSRDMRATSVRSATSCDSPRSRDTCDAESPHVRHRGPNCAMRYTTLPTTGPKARISRAVTRYHIWYLEVRLQHGATIALPFSKNITCFYARFPTFCRGLTVLFSCFRLSLCFLLAADRSRFHYYPVTLYYKNPLYIEKKGEHHHPSESSTLRL